MLSGGFGLVGCCILLLYLRPGGSLGYEQVLSRLKYPKPSRWVRSDLVGMTRSISRHPARSAALRSVSVTDRVTAPASVASPRNGS